MTQRQDTCQGATTFQTTDTSYAQMGLYEDTYITTTGESHTQYAPALAQEWPQPQPFVATFTPTAQVPAPSPAPPARLKRKASSQSLGIRSRGRSPMGHLPYQEDIAKAGIKSRRSPDFSGRSSSPSSTPRPSSPVLQPLTFITYPDLEPKGHGRGGDCDGNGDDDDDDDSSRRGRRGKKQPKKEPFLACFFCRGRKIACHPKNDGGEDRTCTQCAKRRLECKYPQTSRRGQRKPPNTAAIASTTTTACKPRAARASSKRSASSFGRI
ncbi:hypothetical protein EDB86DRAFT_1009092 [Lactarius hatsudake]|nr:hypothetical protein EDB86DRAFT_1009092 [Lactarius hatsudake]